MFQNPFSLLSNIPSLPSGEMNVGGILNMIRVVPASQVRWDESKIQNGIIGAGALTIDANATIANIKIAADSGMFVETSTTSPSGIFWTQEVLFDLPKNRASINAWILQHCDIDFFVMICTKNKESVFLGGIEQPLRFLEESASPSLRAGQNRRTWKLSGMVEHPAYFLSTNYTDI